MQIVDNRVLVLNTRTPEKYKAIHRSKYVGTLPNGLHQVAVYWGLDEARVLRNLGVKNVPSPILRNYTWPARFAPFAHQKEIASFLTLHRKAFVFSEAGTGKTLSALWAADYLMTQGKVRRALILCPLSIMRAAWLEDANKSVIHRTVAIAHNASAEKRLSVLRDTTAEIVVANHDGVNIIGKTVKELGDFDLIIVDECFVAGTLVHTPNGPQPIERLTAGAAILTSAGVAPIKRLVRNTATQLVEVRLGTGRRIRCTPDHPFFTDAGWVCAKNLEGRRLLSSTCLSGMRSRVQAPEAPCSMGSIQGGADRSDLLEILRAEEIPHNEPRRQLLQQDAARTTWASAGSENRSAPSESVRHTESYRAQTPSTRRQRHGDDGDRAVDFRGLACGVGMELPGSVGEEASRLSYKLQARLCVAASANGARSRRQQPHHFSAPSAGSQEGGEASEARVESVTHIECPDGVAVYNVEVEGTPNYFVEDGWLVHNCNAFKNTHTRRWKALHAMLAPETMLWMMTGTPAAQSPLDAFGLAKLVCPDRVPRTRGSWQDKVMTKVSTFKWVPKLNAKELVFSALQPAVRFTKAQCLDLPPVVTLTREVELTPQQKQFYERIRSRMVAEAEGEVITAANAAGCINKLLQISSGAAYTDSGETIEFDCSSRLNVLLEAVEETERKIIVFAPFRSSVQTIRTFLEAQGYVVDEINGDVSESKRAARFRRFQDPNDPLRVLVIQPQAASHGVTLTAADTVVFWGPVFSAETYIQCVARADRVGQDSSKVTVVHLQASAVERRAYKALTEKVDFHQSIVKLYEEEVLGRKSS